MKLLIPLILLFALLNFIANENLSELDKNFFSEEINLHSEESSDSSDILTWAEYHFDVNLLTDQKILEVRQRIIWTNHSESSTDKIYFNLFANSLKSYNPKFQEKITTDSESSGIHISSVMADGSLSSLKFPEVIDGEDNDSSVAFIQLDGSVPPDNSIEIKIQYEIKIPLSSHYWGYAAGREFYLITDWYPKIAVLKNDGWLCNKTSLFSGNNSNFADYSMVLHTPLNLKVGSGANVKSSEINKNRIYYLKQKGVRDFAWFAADEIIFKKRSIALSNEHSVELELFVQPEKSEYSDRYFNAAINSLKFFDNNIGKYPFKKFTIVDIPRTSKSEGFVFSGMATFKVPFFSPIESHQPELNVAKSIARQYFGKSILVNNYSESWIEKGISSFLASEIMKRFYISRENKFKLFSYYPISGLNFLSYNEIPIVYTLGSYEVSGGVTALEEYYKSPLIGSIADPSNIFRDELNYKINSQYKPELMLLSLSAYLGNNSILDIISKIYLKHKFKELNGDEILKIINENSSEDLNWFFENTYFNSRLFDYAISSIKKISENEYEVFAERRGDGVFHTEVALITETDTISQFWNGEERWKIFKFETPNDVVAAMIDPSRVNLFDINFANNSKRLDSYFWPPISLATRWFFWMQNALMILGSI